MTSLHYINGRCQKVCLTKKIRSKGVYFQRIGCKERHRKRGFQAGRCQYSKCCDMLRHSDSKLCVLVKNQYVYEIVMLLAHECLPLGKSRKRQLNTIKIYLPLQTHWLHQTFEQLPLQDQCQQNYTETNAILLGKLQDPC